LLLLAAGAFFYYKSNSFWQPKSAVQADIVLERTKKVLQLVTVQGYFTELYSINEYQGFDFWPFQKKALIRVKAKVLVGYDLEGLGLTTDVARHVVKIQNIGEPQILSIDHELDYYDITEGLFNSFSAADHTRMQGNAKELIKTKALQSGLMEEAKSQAGSVRETLTAMIEDAGWTLEVGQVPVAKPD
jgi:Protein of unknown function (DUF4230)